MRRSRILNDDYQEYLTIGPFGGVDPTTSPYSVADTNFVDMANIIPNQQFGGFVTVPGRIAALASKLPSAPTGIGKMERAGQPDVYLFAVTDASGHGAIYAGQIGGVPYALALPAPLTAGNLTYFVPSRKWIFVSNGVDRPIKIDTSLNVTYWGIIAPTSAPTMHTSGVGPLSGRYYYCETFSNADQESSQGTISAPIDAAGTPASGTLTFGGTVTTNDVLTAVIIGIPVSIQVLAGWSLSYAVTQLAGQVNVNPNLGGLFQATAAGTVLTVTCVNSGSSGNQFSLYGIVSPGATETVTPTAPTAFTGGTDGNSITITPVATTADPQVTTRNLYRIGGSNGTWQLVNSQPVADMTPFLDTIADNLITGQDLVIFRDAPPAFKAIANYQDRIFGFGTEGDPTAVWWSNYNEPWGFNSNTNVQVAGPNSFNDVAVTCGSMGSLLLLLKTRTSYAVVGNSDSTFTVIEGPPVGCTSPTSLAIGTVNGGAYAMWSSRRGIQLFDTAQLSNASRGQYQQSNVKSTLDSFTAYDRSLAVGFYCDSMFCMSYPSKNKTFVLEPASMQWYPLNFALGIAFYDPESDIPVIGSNLQTAGQVDQWFADLVNGDLGEPITAYAISRITDCGMIHADKELVYAYVEAPFQPNAFANVYIFPNPGTDLTPASERFYLDSGPLRHRWELPHGLQVQEFQLQVQTVAKAQTGLHKISVFGKVVRMHKPASDEQIAYAGA